MGNSETGEGAQLLYEYIQIVGSSASSTISGVNIVLADGTQNYLIGAGKYGLKLNTNTSVSSGTTITSSGSSSDTTLNVYNGDITVAETAAPIYSTGSISATGINLNVYSGSNSSTSTSG